MRLINDNPDRISAAWIVNRVRKGDFRPTFVLKATLCLAEGAAAEPWGEGPDLPTGDIPHAGAGEGSLYYDSDFHPHKPRGDVLVVGAAYPPGDEPAPGCRVSIKVGALRKSLNVFGDREWQSDLAGAKPSAPKPFTRMALTYDNAFGGSGSKANPVGKGMAPIEGQNGRKRLPLPNVEAVDQQMLAPASRPDPAGFGPLNRFWQLRMTPLGRHDAKWLKERWPWFAEDFVWSPREGEPSHFNAAPLDQQVAGFFKGDEELAFEHMRPNTAIFRSRLPGWRALCFLAERPEDPAAPAEFREVPLNLDTIWVDMEAGKLVLLWRGIARSRTFRMREVETVYVRAEPLAEPKRSLRDYRDLMLAAIAAADAEFARPPDDGAAEAELAAEIAAMDEAEAALLAEIAAIEKATAAAEAEGEAAAAPHAPPAPAPSGPKAALGAEKAAVADVRAAIAAIGKTDPARAEKLGPLLEEDPEPEAEATRSIAEAEAEAAAEEPADEPDLTREAVIARAAAKGSFAGATLRGLDLAGLDLSGLDFRDADLAGARLARANLEGADLGLASLVGADLTRANLTRARLDGADLRRATLKAAKLTHISIARADLSGGLDLAGQDLSGATGAAADFAGSNLTGVIFTGARLPAADFTRALLAGADLADAAFPDADFDGAKAKGARLSRCDLTKARASNRADFRRASFRGVMGVGSVWEACRMDEADFSRAHLTRAEFPETSLAGAQFDRAHLQYANFEDAVLRRAVLTNANLLRASFERADLGEASFVGANLYEAGFFDAVFAKTDMAGANLKQTLLAQA